MAALEAAPARPWEPSIHENESDLSPSASVRSQPRPPAGDIRAAIIHCLLLHLRQLTQGFRC